MLSNYSDEQLFQILDVTMNPSDRELEAKIIEFIHKHASDKDPTFFHFFNDVYDHFFENNEDENDKDADADKDEDEIKNTKKEGFTASSYTANTASNPNPVALTAPLPYAKDQLNPLLNQTVKRMVVVDSQYRDPIYNLPTNFTFDLSDPLRDVVSLKLYSVSIPYTWYTISTDYGSNFFYLKGTSPGINNGNHDYIIDISAGNYSASNLVSTVNNAIQLMASLNTDISFGITDISYNPFTSLATLTIDLTKIFTETSYYLYFPSYLNPVSNPSSIVRSYTIPSYLGFTNQTIPINAIYSDFNVLPSSVISANADQNNSIYTIDASNNSFQIIQYIGTTINDKNGNAIIQDYVAGQSTIIQTIPITFSLSIGSSYSRNQLQANLGAQLVASTYLYDASLSRIDDTVFITPAVYSYYQMTLVLNQTTTQNIQNSLIAVVFPDETGSTYPVWTGTNSCFSFDNSYGQVNDLYSRVNLLASNYIITNTPILYLQCSEPGYENTLNDYIITVPASNILGYTLDQYLSAINTALLSAKIVANNQDATGNINYTNTDIELSSDSIAGLQIDINNIYSTPDYYIDFTDSILNNDDPNQAQFYFYYNASLHDLSGNLLNKYVFTASLNIQSFYTIQLDSSGNTIPPNVCTIYPNPTLGNKDAVPFVIPFVYNTSFVISNELVYDSSTANQDFANDINRSFTVYMDQNGYAPLSGTLLSFGAPVSSYYPTTLTVNVLKIITQNTYNILLYDVSGVSYIYTNTSWQRNLFFTDISYNLGDYTINTYSQINGTQVVLGETIQLYDNSNNFFYFKPQISANGLYTTTSGSYSGSEYNDIRFDIPAGSYTRTQLFIAMNTLFTNNPLTFGTYIQSVSLNNLEYTELKVCINKIFTANDYSLVFYDTTSFVKCFVGDTSVSNVVWDNTLGWILGYHAQTEYSLSQFTTVSSTVLSLMGDTAVNVNLFNNLFISVDDFNQNRINDGLITITQNQISIPLPSYSSIANFTCDTSGNPIVSGSTIVAQNNLTLNQIYSLNQILNAQQNQPKVYSSGPFLQDLFGLIPLKVSGLNNGQVYSEFGGTLQNQQRLYFGPVNIYRMQIQLYTDKGNILNLNNVNWSFTFEVEQLYQQKKI